MLRENRRRAYSTKCVEWGFSEVRSEATCWQLPTNGKIPNTDNALTLIQRVASCTSRRLGRWLVEIRKLGVGSVAKVLGLLYALIGLIIGLFVALASLLGVLGAAANSNLGPAELGMGIGGGIVGIIVLPILYGIAGVLSGLIVALLYNLVASLVGGIKFETR